MNLSVLEGHYLNRASQMEYIEFQREQEEEMSYYEFLKEKAAHYTPYEFKIEEVSRGCFIAFITLPSIQLDTINFLTLDASAVVGISNFKLINDYLISFRSALDAISLHQNLCFGFIPVEAMTP
mgnify:CR=1 FL=1